MLLFVGYVECKEFVEKDLCHCLTKPSEWFNVHLEHHGANLICGHMSTLSQCDRKPSLAFKLPDFRYTNHSKLTMACNEENTTVDSSADSEVMERNTKRKAYLITYSQADTDVFDRQGFADAVISAFKSETSSEIKQWCCCLEHHKDGAPHYHMAILLDKATRWSRVRHYMQNCVGITVNFSGHGGYYSAYQYVIKEDDSVLYCYGHPERIVKPRTQAASSARVAKRGKNRKKLSKIDVADIITKRKLKTRIELLQHANVLRKRGNGTLYQFCIERSTKTLVDFIGTVWDAENADNILKRKAMDRMEILSKALESPCECDREWIQCALSVLERNNIDHEEFSCAVKELLQKGRGKGRNILLTGPTNCGKTFLLSPLTKIFNAFHNPATGTFAWVGVEDKEIIFLNDFRLERSMITWADMLLLLEGDVVHFSAPKTHYSQDITLDNDTPIFCTSKTPIIYVKNGIIDDRETEMMQVRWHHFQLRHQLRLQDCRDIAACANCFAMLIM